MMQDIKALSLTSDVTDWLADSRHPRILHVFDYACNLINERREVLSIVTAQIGDGPFNLVVESNVLFSEHLHAKSPIFMYSDQLILGDLTINIVDATLWTSRPDWEMLQAKRENIVSQLLKLPITNCQPSLPISLLFSLTTFIVTANISSSITAAKKLAGLGIGLTPSGDDFIMGAVLAAWIIHPLEVASVLAEEITKTAAPLTTSLSAAWLRSVGRGKAGILWHELFETFITGKNIELPITKLLSVGETSGADALAGFIGVCITFNELIIGECPS